MIIGFWKNILRLKQSSELCRRSMHVLGIETSCDDTSAAVVNCSGTVLGAGHVSQARFHVESGGVLPYSAHKLHREYIKFVVQTAIKESNIDVKGLDAVAVTVKPGLPLSLIVGIEYAKDLCSLHRKPLIPIHHMQAHALTARMIQNIKFPFLVFLMSGGHCILAVAKSVDKFFILGETMDISPGVMFDRTARRARLQTLKQYKGLVGGAAIECAAADGNPEVFTFNTHVVGRKNCNFSFAGLAATALQYLEKEEKKFNIQSNGVIPNYKDLSAGLLYAATNHMCQRLQVAFSYVAHKNLLEEENKHLVVSGGVASNAYIRNALKLVCEHYNYKLTIPPPNLCTDNGVMVAWNGVERLKANLPVVQPNDLDSVALETECPLGEDLSENVSKTAPELSVKYVKLRKMLEAKKLEIIRNSVKL